MNPRTIDEVDQILTSIFGTRVSESGLFYDPAISHEFAIIEVSSVTLVELDRLSKALGTEDIEVDVAIGAERLEIMVTWAKAGA